MNNQQQQQNNNNQLLNPFQYYELLNLRHETFQTYQSKMNKANLLSNVILRETYPRLQHQHLLCHENFGSFLGYKIISIVFKSIFQFDVMRNYDLWNGNCRVMFGGNNVITKKFCFLFRTTQQHCVNGGNGGNQRNNVYHYFFDVMVPPRVYNGKSPEKVQVVIRFLSGVTRTIQGYQNIVAIGNYTYVRMDKIRENVKKCKIGDINDQIQRKKTKEPSYIESKGKMNVGFNEELFLDNTGGEEDNNSDFELKCKKLIKSMAIGLKGLTDQYKRTILFYFCYDGILEGVKLCMELGYDFFQKDIFGKTPRMYSNDTDISKIIDENEKMMIMNQTKEKRNEKLLKDHSVKVVQINDPETLNEEFYYSRGEYSKALDVHQNSLQIQKEIGNKTGVSTSLSNIGSIYYSRGEYSKALDFHQKSLQIQKEIGNKTGAATSLNNIGSIYDSLGEYQKSLIFHQQCLKIKKEIGDLKGEADSLLGIGNVYHLLGEYQKSLKFHKQSLKILKEIGDLKGEAIVLINIGVVYESLGEYQKSLKFDKQSLKILKEIGDLKGEAIVLRNIGVVYESLGEYQKSLNFHKQSLKIKKEIGDLKGEADSLLGIGNVYHLLGEHQKSLKFHKQSLKIKKEIGDVIGEAISLRNIAHIYGSQSKFFECISNLNESMLIYKKCQLDKEQKINENLINVYLGDKEEYMKSKIENEIKEKRLSDFEIVKRIGEKVEGKKQYHGCNSQVYQCKLKGHEILFALKVSITYNFDPTKPLDTSNVKDQNEREFIPEKRLERHPNILFNFHGFIDKIDKTTLIGFKGLDSGFISDKTMFVLTYYMKDNLDNHIKKTGVIDEIIFLKFMRDILAGICHLYKNFIVHRDIKPANILLTPDERTVIADFGTHIDLKDSKNFKVIIGKGGTPFFLPPEVLNTKDGDLTDYSKSDLFSAGLVAYELLTKTNEAFTNYSNRKDEEFDHLGKLTNSDYSKEIKELVRNMLKCKVSQRIDCFKALDIVKKVIEKIKSQPST